MKLRAVHALAASALLLVPSGAPDGSLRLEGVAFAGCVEVSRGPTCHVEADAALTLWWPERDDAPVAVTVDGAPVAIRSDLVAGGRRIVVRPPEGARGLSLRVEGQASQRWRLALAPPEAEHSALELARRRRAAGDLDGAEAALRVMRTAALADRAKARSLEARIALARGEAHAAAMFRDAIRAHEAAGHLSRAARDAVALAYTLHKIEHDFEGAERALDRAEPWLEHVAEHRTDVHYERGALAFDAAAPALALEELELAERWARRLNMTEARWMAEQVRAAALMRLGRRAEAEASMAGMEAEARRADPCTRANAMHARVGITFLRVESGDPVASREIDEAARAVRRAAALFTGACARPSSAADAYITLALLELRRGRTQAARDAIESARAALPRMHFDLESWVVEAEARLALSEGRRQEAARRYGALRARAEDALHREAAWRAAWGEAESAADAASRVDALERAEAQLEAELSEVPLGEGRDTLASRRSRTAAALVEAYLARGDDEAAFRSARRARIRALRSFARRGRLEQLPGAERRVWHAALGRYRQGRAELDAELSERWTVPTRDLPAFDAEARERSRRLRRALDEAYRALGPADPVAAASPPPGAMVWLAQRLSRGWALFAREGESLSVARRADDPPVDPTPLGDWAFAPFDDAIDRASQVVLLEPGELASRGLHAASWRGAPLASARPVLRGLDLESASTRRGESGRVLLAIDPQGNLAGARAEHASFAESLSDRAETLIGEAADRVAVLDGLARASVFHFAGHGAAGPRGWDGALRLAGGTELTPADVLASVSVPATVILSGCETGRTEAQAEGVQGVGIAPAFILAGADTVVATTRPISDAAASAFARHLAAATPDQPRRQAIRSALSALRGEHPDEWDAYVVLVAGLGGER